MPVVQFLLQKSSSQQLAQSGADRFNEELVPNAHIWIEIIREQKNNIKVLLFLYVEALTI